MKQEKQEGETFADFGVRCVYENGAAACAGLLLAALAIQARQTREHFRDLEESTAHLHDDQ